LTFGEFAVRGFDFNEGKKECLNESKSCFVHGRVDAEFAGQGDEENSGDDAKTAA
jgi:hypothetical protein